jgi:DNA-binding NtrC family response regulator
VKIERSASAYILTMAHPTHQEREPAQPALGWTVLLVDDEESLRHLLRVILEPTGYTVLEATDGLHAVEMLDDHPEVRIVLTDIRMPRMDGMALLEQIRDRGLRVVMMSAYGSSATAVEALDRGALDYISKPFRAEEIRQCLKRIRDRDRLETENARLREHVGADPGLGGFVGRSEAARKVQDMVRKVAGFPSTVLLTGESGTGKELLARALHACSPRANRPLVAINCAAIPETLLESEVFGHERGAFTGAVRAHAGLFEQADRGTLFLDEIGDMPLSLQTRLLRILEDGQVRRIGGSGDRTVDVRLVAATAQDLDAAVEAGRFRQDLLYRLKVVHIRVPPLRERRTDIPLICDALLLRIAERHKRESPALSIGALRVLEGHRWQGNVRELENALERAVLMCDGARLEVEHLPDDLAGSAAPIPPDVGEDLSIKRRTATLERALIQRALAQTEGNRTQAARLLDISYKALLYKIRGYGLDD